MGESTRIATEAPPLGRQHSRSSSQLATLGSGSGTASYPASPSKQRAGTQSPRYSIDGLRPYDRGPPALDEDSDNYSSPEMDRKAAFPLQSPPRRIDPLPFTTSPTLSATPDPASDTQHSTPELSTSSPRTETPSLANLIQQRRRQASAPYFASARSSSLFSPGAGFGIPSTSAVPYGESATSGNSSWAGAWGNPSAFIGAAADEEERRARSRRQSRAGTVSGLSLKPTTSFGNNGFGRSLSGQREPSEEYDGMRNQGMVMTPTTEVRRGQRCQKVTG